ncbi:MAG TPA: hypothetical protein VK851_09740 [Anaerolineales bacterium]|nr:hypothetical protein [Anaerolineales bacterium]
MKSKTLALFIVLAFLVQACNLPSSAAGTETPTPESSVEPSATEPLPTDTPTETPLPTDTPPPTLTSTPSVPIAFPRDVAVNCRFGPGTAWVVLSGLQLGQTSQIVGKNTNSSWWYIVDPQNASRNCWISASVVDTAGNLANIPTVATPTASVTNVTVSVDPQERNVGGCVGPIPPSEIEGTIEVNGPTTVKWYFETQQTGAMPVDTTDFDSAGSKTFTADFTPLIAAGTYWVRMVVTEPNGTQAETTYKINC